PRVDGVGAGLGGELGRGVDSLRPSIQRRRVSHQAGEPEQEQAKTEREDHQRLPRCPAAVSHWRNGGGSASACARSSGDQKTPHASGVREKSSWALASQVTTYRPAGGLRLRSRKPRWTIPPAAVDPTTQDTSDPTGEPGYGAARCAGCEPAPLSPPVRHSGPVCQVRYL